MPHQRVRVFAPASLSNLGPGFDVLGLAIRSEERPLGDFVVAERISQPGVQIVGITGADVSLPLVAEENTAAVAAAAVLRDAGSKFGVSLLLQKSIPLGSGIGGSAASAVAGAFAANLLLGSPLPKERLVEAVLEAEAVAAGGRHGDNVLPSLFGGCVISDPATPERYRGITLPQGLHLALCLPAVRVFTHEARAALPSQVPLKKAVRNAAALAWLVAALNAGDWPEVGRRIMQDELIEPVRAEFVSVYAPIRNAAMKAGAYGCALSGSGPAMFAIASDAKVALNVALAMRDASLMHGVSAWSSPVIMDVDGVRYCNENN